MKIKICGMREAANITAVAGLNPDYLGYIFYKKSPRYAGGEEFCENLSLAAGSAVKTAVFVDEEISEICRIQQLYHFGAVQLHGNESPGFCAGLRALLPEGVQIFKAFGMKAGFDFTALDAFQPHIDFFLFDTSTAQKGGSGITFDWALLQDYHLLTPYWLSGGMGIAEIARALETGHLADTLYGFDLNSKLELKPGEKDVSKVRLIMQLRDAWLAKVVAPIEIQTPKN